MYLRDLPTDAVVHVASFLLPREAISFIHCVNSGAHSNWLSNRQKLKARADCALDAIAAVQRSLESMARRAFPQVIFHLNLSDKMSFFSPLRSSCVIAQLYYDLRAVRNTRREDAGLFHFAMQMVRLDRIPEALSASRDIRSLRGIDGVYALETLSALSSITPENVLGAAWHIPDRAVEELLARGRVEIALQMILQIEKQSLRESIFERRMIPYLVETRRFDALLELRPHLQPRLRDRIHQYIGLECAVQRVFSEAIVWIELIENDALRRNSYAQMRNKVFRIPEFFNSVFVLEAISRDEERLWFYRSVCKTMMSCEDREEVFYGAVRQIANRQERDLWICRSWIPALISLQSWGMVAVLERQVFSIVKLRSLYRELIVPQMSELASLARSSAARERLAKFERLGVYLDGLSMRICEQLIPEQNLALALEMLEDVVHPPLGNLICFEIAKAALADNDLRFLCDCIERMSVPYERKGFFLKELIPHFLRQDALNLLGQCMNFVEQEVRNQIIKDMIVPFLIAQQRWGEACFEAEQISDGFMKDVVFAKDIIPALAAAGQLETMCNAARQIVQIPARNVVIADIVVPNLIQSGNMQQAEEWTAIVIDRNTRDICYGFLLTARLERREIREVLRVFSLINNRMLRIDTLAPALVNHEHLEDVLSIARSIAQTDDSVFMLRQISDAFMLAAKLEQAREVARCILQEDERNNVLAELENHPARAHHYRQILIPNLIHAMQHDRALTFANLIAPGPVQDETREYIIADCMMRRLWDTAASAAMGITAEAKRDRIYKRIAARCILYAEFDRAFGVSQRIVNVDLRTHVRHRITLIALVVQNARFTR